MFMCINRMVSKELPLIPQESTEIPRCDNQSKTTSKNHSPLGKTCEMPSLSQQSAADLAPSDNL